MTALNTAMPNGPASARAYEGHQTLRTMKHWTGIERRSESRTTGEDEILAAAILEDGIIHWCAKPCRHHHVISAKWSTNESGFTSRAVQGFLTKNGRFLNRVEARELAVSSGIKPSHPQDLFSEDLW